MGDFGDGLGGGLVNKLGSPGEVFGNNGGGPGNIFWNNGGSPGKKRGRPAKDVCKRRRQDIRMTDEQSNMLDYICDKTGKTKTEVLLEGLRIQHNLYKFK